MGANVRVLAVAWLLGLVTACGGATDEPAVAETVQQVAVVSVTPLTWDVVGLDVNDLATAPNRFPVGVRIRNTGDATATNLTAAFSWQTANANINLVGPSSLAFASLAPGATLDAYFDVEVAKVAAAVDTARRYVVTVSGTGFTTATSPTPRQIYVEKIISQGRNDVASITGPTQVRLGETVQYVMTASTAPGGYEQLSTSATFSSSMWQVLGTQVTYSAPTGGTNTRAYADACGWQPDPTLPNYKSCVGPVQYTGGKAGGSIEMTYTVKAVGAGSALVTGLILDFSGASYHYNADFGGVGLTVTVHTPPTATNDAYSVAEDAALTVAAAAGVLANDTEPNGGALTATLVTGPAHGTLTLNANGSFTYTPNANYTGPDSFTYRANSATSTSSAATVTLTVTPVNDPPTAVNDTPAVAEDSGATVIDVLANDSSAPDGAETLTVIAVTQPANGSVTLVGGIVRFSPAANFAGTTTFTYTIADGNGGTRTATVTVTVTGTNDPPTATDDAITVAEDGGAAVVAVLANDSSAPDAGETLTVTGVTQPAGGTVAITTGGSGVTFTPSLNFAGTTSFTYTVSDGQGGTATATATVTVTPANDPPTAVADTLGVAEDSGPTIVPVLANDTSAPDGGETLTVTAITQPASGAVTLVGGIVRFTPAANFAGTTSFAYTISDGNGGTATASVSVTVAAVNDPPVAAHDTATVGEDAGPAAILVLANDSTGPDAGETLTITSVTQAANGTVAITAGGASVTFTPAPDYSGTTSFAYTVSDGNGGTATATTTVTVTPVNDAPDAADDAATVAKGAGATTIDVRANDTTAPDPGETLVITTVTQPANGTVTIAPGGATLAFTPSVGFEGTTTFTYTVSDGQGGTDTATVTVTVIDTNTPPTAVADARTLPEDSDATSLDVLANDTTEPGETLTIAAVTQPANGTVAITGGGSGLTFRPAADFSGTTAFTYTVSDGNGGTDTATVTVTITPTNDAPVAVADRATVSEDGGATTIAVLGNDTTEPDAGETLVITDVTQPTGGAVTITGGGTSIAFTPAPNFEGTATFTYTISDGQGGTATATVTVVVTGVNDAPTARDDRHATERNAAATPIDVLANDTSAPDTGETLRVASVTQPASGVVVITGNGAGLTFQPAPNFVGTTTFGYTLSDGRGGSDTATVTVVVADNNIAPTAVDDTATVAEDSGTTTLDVLANDVREPGETLTVASVTQPANGTVAITTGGAGLTFTPAPDFEGTATFTYTISDGRGESATATVTIDVTGVNDAPVAGDDVATVAADGGPVPIDVLANDGIAPDVNETLTINAVTQPTRGTVTITGGGTGLTFAPSPGFLGTVTFTYTVADGHGGTATATVTVTVTGTDTDDDGLTDTYEMEIGTNFEDADSDDDGAIDGAEPLVATDSDRDGLPNGLDPDSDNDGLYDGTELGVTAPHADTDPAAGHFVPDADPSTTTDPLDADTDDGGVEDGAEDTDADGQVDTGERDPNVGSDDGVSPDDDGDGLPDAVELALGTDPADADSDDDGVLDGAEANYQSDSDRDGLINALDPDSDNDGLYDGTEVGVATAHPDTNVGAGHFRADADPTTTTSMLDPDSDDGGIEDGAEDADGDGQLDGGERDPNVGTDDAAIIDTDGDGLPDALEIRLHADPADADTDDDGVLDGSEANYQDDTDGDGLANVLDPDSDNDGLTDGTETGITTPSADTDVGAGHFTPDADPTTTTGVLEPDTDGGGIADGAEDTNQDGRADAGELDPRAGADDATALDSDDDGLPDAVEVAQGTDPQDADSDDDGAIDGAEPNWSDDTDGDGAINALDPDSDADGILDGTELGLTEPHADTDVTAGHFTPDADPSTTTSPVNPDSDWGGASDGAEDADHDGQVDAGERDPDNEADDESTVVPPVPDRDTDGIRDEADNCPDVANPAQIDEDADGAGQACDPDDNGDGWADDVGVAGGGCSSTQGGGAGGALALLGVAAALRRRRRFAVAASVAAGVAGPTVAHAQLAEEPQDFSVERFRLATDRAGILNVESAESRGDMAFDVALWVGYANDPLNVYRTMDGDRERVGSLVQDRTAASLVAAMSPTRWLTLGFEVPLVLAQDRDAQPAVAPMGVGSLSSFGVGDVRLVPKLTLLRQERAGVSVAVVPVVYVPTGGDEGYRGDGRTGFAPMLAVSRRWPGARLALDVGWHARRRTGVLDLDVANELFALAGFGLRFGERAGGPPVGLDFTVSTAFSSADPFTRFNQNHVEGLTSLSVNVTPRAILFAAGGVGLREGYGTPDWRALAGVRFGAPEAPAKIQDVVRQVALPPPVDRDPDRDRVLDPDDRCPREHGLVELVGCPAQDRDGDAVADHRDACPGEAEDVDAFEDADGCPEPDNDRDTVADIADRCPLEAGVVETAGCPDPDRDGDAVADRLDNCPDERGEPAHEGCAKKQLVKITNTSLEILESVYFQLNKAVILPRSFPLLDNVASVLASHATIEVEVQGHTDSKGNDAYNKKLSQRRADAVMAYLVKKGVARTRLAASGHGEEQPVADNASAEGRAQNRRVVFKIVGGGAVQTKEQGASDDTIERP